MGFRQGKAVFILVNAAGKYHSEKAAVVGFYPALGFSWITVSTYGSRFIRMEITLISLLC